MLSAVVVVLLLRLLIKLNWSWWWETTGQGRHGAVFLTVRSRSRSQWPMGRECLIGAPGPTQTQATTSRESQASICFVSVANNHYWSFSDKVILVYSLKVGQNACSVIEKHCELYFSNKLVKKTYLCQNRRMSGLYKKNLRRFFSGTLSIWLDWMNCFCGLFVS